CLCLLSYTRTSSAISSTTNSSRGRARGNRRLGCEAIRNPPWRMLPEFANSFKRLQNRSGRRRSIAAWPAQSDGGLGHSLENGKRRAAQAAGGNGVVEEHEHGLSGGQRFRVPHGSGFVMRRDDQADRYRAPTGNAADFVHRRLSRTARPLGTD